LYHATVSKLIGKFKRWQIERVFQQKKRKKEKNLQKKKVVQLKLQRAQTAIVKPRHFLGGWNQGKRTPEEKPQLVSLQTDTVQNSRPYYVLASLVAKQFGKNGKT
jgi:ribulose kinase